MKAEQRERLIDAKLENVQKILDEAHAVVYAAYGGARQTEKVPVGAREYVESALRASKLRHTAFLFSISGKSGRSHDYEIIRKLRAAEAEANRTLEFARELARTRR
jgi:hypothetical protein